jgi:hypothetical protein
MRVEDAALREYLLRLATPDAAPPGGGVPVALSDRLPASFTALLTSDRRLHDLWEGTGKPEGTDRSVSGYDFSIVRHLARLGVRDPDQLGTILSLRPAGFAERSAKGHAYFERTVGSALRNRRI